MGNIDIRHLSHTYSGHQPFTALHDVSLHIKNGEFLCVVGPSGCGKTTLLNALAGLLSPTSGRITIGGAPLCGPGTDRALAFQHSPLFPWMTAEKNVVFGIRQANKTIIKKQAEEKAASFLRQVGVWEARNKYPNQLSGGMQQRVALARVLAINADILLLDEPFGALDTACRATLQALLERLWHNNAKQKTVVFVTHDVQEAVLLADRVVFMCNGAIKAEFPVPFARPRRAELLYADAAFKTLAAQLTALFYQHAVPCGGTCG